MRIAAVILLLTILAGCSKPIEKEPVHLSELQISACNSAHEANTCDTRLADVEIVKKEDCCKALGKCC